MVTLDDYSEKDHIGSSKKDQKPKTGSLEQTHLNFTKKTLAEIRKLSTKEIQEYLEEAEGKIPEREIDEIQYISWALEYKENGFKYGNAEITRLFDGTIIAQGDFAHCVRGYALDPNKVKNILHNIKQLYKLIKKQPKFRGTISLAGGYRFGIYKEGFTKKDQFKEFQRHLEMNKNHYKDESERFYHYHHYIVTEVNGELVLTFTDLQDKIFGITDVWET